MKKKIMWLAASCLMVAALLLASCAPTPATPTPIPTPTPTPSPTITPGPEAPKYGGELIVVPDRPTTGVDEAYTQPHWDITWHLTNEDLIEGDWTKGPTGSNQAEYSMNMPLEAHLMSGALAESWEVTDDVTVAFHIRKGVHFALNPNSAASRLVNGREVDANDVAFSINRLFTTPTAYVKIQHPWGTPTVTVPDKWTVVVKSLPGYTGEVFRDVGTMIKVVPHEVIEKYGDLRMWENSVGTGAFMLVDLVPASTNTFIRNPNYWQKDPMGPGKGNPLPYLDSIKQVIIMDNSTKLAAMRAHKVDWISIIPLEDKLSVAKTNPELKWARYFDNSKLITMRIDTKPFDDIRVRQALVLAVDYNAILKDFFKNDASILARPIAPLPEFKDAYIPLDKQPPAVQELYSYNPEKAKKLLAEAGYPTGFKTEIVTYERYVDLLSIYKAYWEKIGVDLKLDVKEYGVWLSIKEARTEKYMYILERGSATPFKMLDFKVGSSQNHSRIDDKFTNETMDLVFKYWNEPAKRNEVFKKWIPYSLEQAWLVPVPTPYVYYGWTPWIKNYNGEYQVGYGDLFAFAKWIWCDRDLKEKMTGRR